MMFMGKNSIADKRLGFSHQWRSLVASSEYGPWVGCLRLSLGFYSPGTGSARERDGKFSKQNAVTRRWFSAVLLIIGENLWGRLFNWI